MEDFTKEELTYLRSINIVVATPCYGEMASSHYMISMWGLAKLSAKLGINIGIITVGNQSLITRARNEIVSDFLETGYSHLIFIDADISFEPEYVLRLALHKRKVAVGAYPLKGLDWSRAAKQDTADGANRASVNYVINLTPEQTNKASDNDGRLTVDVHDGLIEVYDAGTGFMMIERSVIEAMIDAYGEELSYEGDTSTLDANGKIKKDTKIHYALFDTSIDLATNRYLSEDYTFCRRWQHLGGKIWCDPSIVLNHHGSYTYRGYNFLDQQ